MSKIEITIGNETVTATRRGWVWDIERAQHGTGALYFYTARIGGKVTVGGCDPSVQFDCPSLTKAAGPAPRSKDEMRVWLCRAFDSSGFLTPPDISREIHKRTRKEKGLAGSCDCATCFS